MTHPTPLLDELRWRGMLHQHTDALDDALTAGQVTGYAGFDPSASSLHIGNLIPVMGLAHLQRAGHRPIILVGGGTGMIGDPSGRTAERQLHSPEQVEQNSRNLRRQLERFLDFDGPAAARLMNNAEWLLPLDAITFMRDVGKHFTINYMLAKDSVKSRIDAGISYTEFSYMLLQAYDYLELHRRAGATLQLGGSDQWGNITAGMELIRRTVGADTHALTLQLLLNASGTKFGKSEGGSVWLDPELTSPYKFYQFWVNVADRDAGKYLRYFTLFPRDDIEALDRALVEKPEKRDAQHSLARDVTRRVHGDAALAAAEEVSQLLFGGGDPKSLSKEALEALKDEIPYFRVEKSGPVDTNDVIESVSTGPDALFKSKGDARRMIQQGGVYINGRRLGPEREQLSGDDLLAGRYVLVRKGARSYALVEIVGARS